jgi:hypothetical protein
MKWMGYIACTRDRRGAHRVLVGKPEGKRPLGKPRHIKVYLPTDVQENCFKKNIKIYNKRW